VDSLFLSFVVIGFRELLFTAINEKRALKVII
jgi:hypothetical protein